MEQDSISPSILNSGCSIAKSAQRTPTVLAADSLLMENLGSGRSLSAQKVNFNKKPGSNFNAINTSGSVGSKLAARTVIQDLMEVP